MGEIDFGSPCQPAGMLYYDGFFNYHNPLNPLAGGDDKQTKNAMGVNVLAKLSKLGEIENEQPISSAKYRVSRTRASPSC